MKYLFAIVSVLAVACQQYRASPIAVNEKGEDQEGIQDVKELESLRTETTSKTNVSSTQHKASQVESTEPQPNSRSAIFRHRGIVQAKKNRPWNDKPKEYSRYNGIQYSPADLAAYVYSTGDEEGVAVAVEELVREGMMGRTDAINYLQDVKQYLDYMKEQGEERKQLEEMKSSAYPKPQLSQRFPNIPREQFISDLAVAEKREEFKASEAPPVAVTSTEQPQKEVIASTSEPKGLTHFFSTTLRPLVLDAVKEDDFKRMDRVEEKALYKLAYDVFTESLVKEDYAEEDSLAKLMAFLENEVLKKRISNEEKKIILAIISSALVDSMQDYQKAMGSQNVAERNFYRLLGVQNHPALSKLDMPETWKKLPMEG